MSLKKVIDYTAQRLSLKSLRVGYTLAGSLSPTACHRHLFSPPMCCSSAPVVQTLSWPTLLCKRSLKGHQRPPGEPRGLSSAPMLSSAAERNPSVHLPGSSPSLRTVTCHYPGSPLLGPRQGPLLLPKLSLRPQLSALLLTRFSEPSVHCPFCGGDSHTPSPSSALALSGALDKCLQLCSGHFT